MEVDLIGGIISAKSNYYKEDYRLIIPILDGHFGSCKKFISIEDNAKEIINFVDNNFKGKVKLLCGLSLGGQISLEIISQRNSVCDYAIIRKCVRLSYEKYFQIH